MKKIISLLIIGFLFLPSIGLAKTYNLKDVSIFIDDSKWTVLTRDNINNINLEEQGISSSQMNDFMQKYSVYVNAIPVNRDASVAKVLLITIRKRDNVNNLHTYSDNSIKELAEDFKKTSGASSYEIYSTGKYKYIHINYYDKFGSAYVNEYVTIMNGYVYSIGIQKSKPVSSTEIYGLKEIVDSAKYKYNSKYEAKTIFKNLFEKFIIGGLAAFILCGLGFLFKKNDRNKKDKNTMKKEKLYVDETIKNQEIIKTIEVTPITEEKEKEEEYLACDRCGGKVEESDTRCPNCGAIFEDEIEEKSKKKEHKKKNKAKDKKKLEEKEKYTAICSNCGAKVKDSDKKCPKCGEKFEEKETSNTTGIDQKYSDLMKLKELLDNKVISKEEFKKEKEKILKD